MDGVGRLQDRLRPFSLSKPCGEDPPVLQGVSAAQPFEPVPSFASRLFWPCHESVCKRMSQIAMSAEVSDSQR